MNSCIDVICPVYREAASIELFHERLTASIAPLRARYAIRVVYVVDPSPDRTEAFLAEIASRDQDVVVLIMSRRFGHQAALIAGIEQSHADAVVMLDSDLQHPPELIPELVEQWESGAEIVQTLRQDTRETKFLKRRTSAWFYLVLMKIGTVDLPVGATDYRLLSARVAALFRTQLQEQNPFVRGLVHWVGFKTVYVPFTPSRRAGGQSNYGPVALIGFAINGIFAFSKVPLRFCIISGIVVAALSLLGGLLQIIVYVFSDRSVPGWPTLVVFLSFMAGVQLFFLGVLGEYIGQVFDEVKARPRYLIDRTIETDCRKIMPDKRPGDPEKTVVFDSENARDP